MILGRGQPVLQTPPPAGGWAVTCARERSGASLLVLAACLCVPATAQPAATAPAAPDALPNADRMEPLPEELRNVGIDEHRNARLPLDAEFVDHSGQKVRLGKYFDGQRPVILTLNYYRCPMLCGIMLNAMVDMLRQLDWTAGDQFQLVTVSFDPLETHALAAIKRQNYLQAYGRPEAADGWHFLTGRKRSIDALLETTGFRVQWNERRQEWMHVAALILCTPDGRISRYLVDIVYDPKTVRLSLVEASEGKIGSALDHILLFCYHYDGKGYSLAAMNIVRGGGLLTLIAVATMLAVLWRRERRKRLVASIAPAAGPGPEPSP